MFITILLLVLSLIALFVGGHGLVDGAAALAKSYKIPNIIIGLTIVAFGTSTPELVVSVYGAMKGNSDIAIGNVVGSNICNILLILGLSAAIFPLTILNNTIKKEIPLSLLSAILIFVMIKDSIFVDPTSKEMISRSEGITLISFFIIFLIYLFTLLKNQRETESSDHHIKSLSKSKQIFFIVGGLTLLVGGGKVFVDQAVKLSMLANIKPSVIGLTVVAIGTSLPELVTSVIAALKKNSEIAVGNVVGSNIFNSFFILGTSAIISPLDTGNITNVDFLVSILIYVPFLLFGFVFGKNSIGRKEGILFVIAYILYLIYLINNS